MAYNNRTGIIDRFNGIEDLEGKIIRCVGDPVARFSEDALRILRAIRFAAQLNFDIHRDTVSAIVMLRENLEKISRERIQVELDKLLMSGNGDKAFFLYTTGVIDVIFKDTDCLITKQSEDWWKSTADILKKAPENHYIRWAALLRGEDKPEALLKSLKLDNKTINIVSKLVKSRESYPEAVSQAVRRHICEIGADIYPIYLDYMSSVCGEDTKEVTAVYEKIIADGDCLSMKDLQVKGADLKEIGITPGKEMGQVLDKLFDMVLTDPKLNEKEVLLKKAKEFA